MLAAASFLVLAVLACGGDGNGGGGGNVQLTLINNSGEEVYYVYISPVTDDTWGDDWLGSTETIPSGSRRTFSVPPGDYDLRADGSSQTALVEEYEVTISGDMTWTIEP